VAHGELSSQKPCKGCKGCKRPEAPPQNRETHAHLQSLRPPFASCAQAERSCARAADRASASMPAATGTRSTEPCAATTALVSSADTHDKCRTKAHERPGRTKACVTSRASPFSTTRLQPLHRALLVGASPTENVCGRVLKPRAITLTLMDVCKSRGRAALALLTSPSPPRPRRAGRPCASPGARWPPSGRPRWRCTSLRCAETGCGG